MTANALLDYEPRNMQLLASGKALGIPRKPSSTVAWLVEMLIAHVYAAELSAIASMHR